MAARKPLVYLNGRVGQLAAGDSITVDFSWLANKPTTLAGYGITDALNVNGVQTVVGVKTFTDDLFINTTAASGGLVISAPAGSLAEIWLRSGTLLRWSIRKSNEAESGSDAGSNLDINSYTDAGAIKSRVARWNRNTGILDFTNMPTVGGAALYTLATAPTYYSNTSGYNVNNLLPGQRVTVGASVTNAPVSAGITYWYIECASTYLADGASRVQRAVSWDGAVSALRTLHSGTWTAWAFIPTLEATQTWTGANTFSQAVRLSATGALLIDGGQPHSTIGLNPVVSIATDENQLHEFIAASNTSAYSAKYNMYRARGSNASYTSVANGDAIGAHQFVAYVAGWNNIARMQVVVDGTPGATYAPAAMEFATSDGSTAMATRWRLRPAGHWEPFADNAYNVGSAAGRCAVIYAGTGTINTSDAREKTVRGPLNDAERAAAQELRTAGVIYQWNAAIAEKGDDARLHCSPTVQSVIAIMQSHGLDPFRYGFVCYDQWPETPEVVESWPDEYDDDGNLIREAGSEVTQEYRPAGDRYSLRPSELLFFILAGM